MATLFKVTIWNISRGDLQNRIKPFNGLLNDPSNISDTDKKNILIINKYFTSTLKSYITDNYPTLPISQLMTNNVFDIFTNISSLRSQTSQVDTQKFIQQWDALQGETTRNIKVNVLDKQIPDKIIENLSMQISQN